MGNKVLTTTEKVEIIMANSDLDTKIDFAKELGISRPTFDVRLATGNWKKLEEKTINTLYNNLKIK